MICDVSLTHIPRKLLVNAHTLHQQQEAAQEEHQIRFRVHLKEVTRSLKLLAGPDRDENMVSETLARVGYPLLGKSRI